MRNAEYGRGKGGFIAEMRSRRPVGRGREARRFVLKKYVLDHARAAAIIVAASCVAGIAYNHLYPRGIFVPVPSVVSKPPTDAKVCRAKKAMLDSTRTVAGHGTVESATERPAPRVVELTLEQAKRRYDEHNALFVDARARSLYELGHIPGAICVPSSDVGGGVPSLPGGLDAAVVVYCVSPDCDEAGIVSKALVARGYREVLLFKGGWNAWLDANYPQQKGNP
jgi:rhodanese-related sulfurtransferase